MNSLWDGSAKKQLEQNPASQNLRTASEASDPWEFHQANCINCDTL